MSEKGKNDEKGKYSFWNKIFKQKNFTLTLTAVLFAVILWNYVVLNGNPEREKSLNDIKLSPMESYMEVLQEKSLAIADEDYVLPDNLETVILVKHNSYADTTSATVSAELDFSHVTSSGLVEVPIKVKTMYGRVLSVEPETVLLNIEPRQERNVPVRLNEMGEVPEGMRYQGNIDCAPENIHVAGPKSIVSQISYAQVDVDLGALAQVESMDINYDFYDKNGDKIKKERITASINYVRIEAQTYPVEEKKIKNDLASLFTGNVKPGYVVVDVIITPEGKKVSAPQNILKDIKELELSPIELNGQSESFDVPGEIRITDGVVWIQPLGINVRVIIEEETVERTFLRVKVDAESVVSKYKAKVLQSVDVIVSGPASIVNNLSKNDISAYVDCKNLLGGTHSVPVIIDYSQVVGIEASSLTEYIDVVIE